MFPILNIVTFPSVFGSITFLSLAFESLWTGIYLTPSIVTVLWVPDKIGLKCYPLILIAVVEAVFLFTLTGLFLKIGLYAFGITFNGMYV